MYFQSCKPLLGSFMPVLLLFAWVIPVFAKFETKQWAIPNLWSYADRPTVPNSLIFSFSKSIEGQDKSTECRLSYEDVAPSSWQTCNDGVTTWRVIPGSFKSFKDFTLEIFYFNINPSDDSSIAEDILFFFVQHATVRFADAANIGTLPAQQLMCRQGLGGSGCTSSSSALSLMHTNEMSTASELKMSKVLLQYKKANGGNPAEGSIDLEFGFKLGPELLFTCHTNWTTGPGIPDTHPTEEHPATCGNNLWSFSYWDVVTVDANTAERVFLCNIRMDVTIQLESIEPAGLNEMKYQVRARFASNDTNAPFGHSCEGLVCKTFNTGPVPVDWDSNDVQVSLGA